MNIIKILSDELKITEKQVENTLKLIDEGNTIPFIARYRKELTGSLDDEILRQFDARLTYLRSLDERREEITRLIDEQGKLTDELKEKIDAALTLSELEDIYRPYRPKRRTRATIAAEKGLEPLADLIFLQSEKRGNPADYAEKYIDPEKGVNTAEEALGGAADIIAERISDDADIRKAVRNASIAGGVIRTNAKTDEDSVYSMYYDYTESVKNAAGHRILAINRGEKENFLSVSIECDDGKIINKICNMTVRESIFTDIMKTTAADAYSRLIKPSVEREIRNMLTEKADENAIESAKNPCYNVEKSRKKDIS